MEKIEANSNFANKLWNICKFVTGNALKDLIESELAELAVDGPIGQEEFDSLSLPEKLQLFNQSSDAVFLYFFRRTTSTMDIISWR